MYIKILKGTKQNIKKQFQDNKNKHFFKYNNYAISKLKKGYDVFDITGVNDGAGLITFKELIDFIYNN